MLETDVLIIGGGLAGATLMLALAGLGVRSQLIEANPISNREPTDFDARTLALAPASVRLLQMLQVWPLLEAEASSILSVHVSEQHRFGQLEMQGTAETPLGHVVEMQQINQALNQLLPEDQLIAPATVQALDPIKGEVTFLRAGHQEILSARLIVAADGTDSTVRRLCHLQAQVKAYEQLAVVANIGLARPHCQKAYERFTPSGPLALLPMSHQRSALVWALEPKEAEQMLARSERDFLKALQRAFGYRLGRFVKAGKRVIYPLKQVLMPKQVLGSVVFVGNAAHTLHPVAGQGFNLGLRDVAMLAQCIAEYGLDSNMLVEYQRLRKQDTAVITYLTDGLIAVYANRLPGVSVLRGAGLLALEVMPPLQQVLTRYTQGFGGVSPDLICGIPLRSRHDLVV